MNEARRNAIAMMIRDRSLSFCARCSEIVEYEEADCPKGCYT